MTGCCLGIFIFYGLVLLVSVSEVSLVAGGVGGGIVLSGLGGVVAGVS